MVVALSLDPVAGFTAPETAFEPAPEPAAVPATGRLMPSVDGDLVRSYLRDIGRVPLLSHEQEITLGRQVQELMALEELESELQSRLGALPSH